MVGRRSAPSGTRRPNASAGEKHEREIIAQKGETDGSQRREGAVAACRGMEGLWQRVPKGPLSSFTSWSVCNFH